MIGTERRTRGPRASLPAPAQGSWSAGVTSPHPQPLPRPLPRREDWERGVKGSQAAARTDVGAGTAGVSPAQGWRRSDDVGTSTGGGAAQPAPTPEAGKDARGPDGHPVAKAQR